MNKRRRFKAKSRRRLSVALAYAAARVPRGAHVTAVISRGNDIIGYFAIGEVRGHSRGRLKVRHFNGEPWPVMPFAHEVSVLERTYDSGKVSRAQA